ncbi:hypothetical protein AABC73_20695 [Pseudomonas sp. G.S.17]|uniref:hypothetical protein n=1 Tax=Pseudomonas sp. G.S.17 TaxID=3137451 RepID=UPI00311CA3D4
MSNNHKLKILCQRLTEQQFCSVHDAELALEKFEKLTTPAIVLGLIEENDAMKYQSLADRRVIEALRSDEAGFQRGAKAEADAGDEARAEVRKLTAEKRDLLKLVCAPEEEVRQENRWLKQVIESYALQMAPLEPIPDEPGYSRRLPGYDLPTLARNSARYCWLKNCDVHQGNRLVIQAPNEIWDQIIDAAIAEESRHANEA